jgi:arylsulfatase A-like enzyme
VDRVPKFLPDNETVRTDLLDYAFEVEHFDRHLGRMLELLQTRGQLDNTLVLVTADNGLPFPRAKGQVYEASVHLPLAAMWRRGIQNPGRVVDDFVSFIDFAPTFLELAGVREAASGMQPIQGRSLNGIFRSEKSGQVIPERDHVLVGKERHDVGRPHDGGYPIRGIVKDGYLYLHNFEISRWPVGNPETGYLNCDGSPSKTWIIQSRKDTTHVRFWQLCFGKRPTEEFYNLAQDPDCTLNLAADADHASRKQTMKSQLFAELKAQGDPRMEGRGHVFDEYIYADEKTRNFYERFMRGEKVRAGWVNDTDFDPH